jgi:hypothetical protein
MEKETTHTHPEGLVKSQNAAIQRGFELRIALEKNSYPNKHSLHGFLRYVYLKNTRMGFPLSATWSVESCMEENFIWIIYALRLVANICS